MTTEAALCLVRPAKVLLRGPAMRAGPFERLS
jgi:hypothetical protein